MNINHKTLIENLTAVLWEPGHMGSFFGRFLLDDIKTVDHFEINQTPNLEWNWDDIINNYMISRQPHGITLFPFSTSSDILRKYYTNQVDLDSAMIFANVYHKYKSLRKPITLDKYITGIDNAEKYLLDIVNRKFTFDHIFVDKKFTSNNIEFPYIKGHLSTNFDIIEKLPFKKKIYCSFSLEKSWIPILLVFYKHYLFLKNNKKWNILSQEFMFFNLVDNPRLLDTIYKHSIQLNNVDDYIEIDMYDLIFNENLSQLHDLNINELSQTRRYLLKRARDDILFVCNKFGLNPTINVSSFQEWSNKLSPEIFEIHNSIKNNTA